MVAKKHVLIFSEAIRKYTLILFPTKLRVRKISVDLNFTQSRFQCIRKPRDQVSSLEMGELDEWMVPL